jgi:hypothetical protein
MAVTYTWSVVQMDAYPEEDGKTDVVFNVHWSLAGIDQTYQGYAYGTQTVSINPDEPFTPYEDLTEAQVIGWVQNAMGAEQVASCETNVAKQIEDQISPPVITPSLPWAVTEVAETPAE